MSPTLERTDGRRPRVAAVSRKTLEAKIEQIKQLKSGEPDMYTYLHQLLTDPAYGLGLKDDQIITDSIIVPGTRSRPDISIFETLKGRAARRPEHLYAVIEAKKDNKLSKSVNSIYKEKSSYLQPGTRYFYLLDQNQVRRYDLVEGGDATDWTWDDIKDRTAFDAAFGCISARHLRLEEKLEQFKLNKTRFAHVSVAKLGKAAFVGTIREVSLTLSEAIRDLINRKVTEDLRQAQELITPMEAKWGTAEIDWSAEGRPIEFEKITNEKHASVLTQEEIADYEQEHDQFDAAIKPFLYAIRIETQLLLQYADRMGFKEQPSLLGVPIRNGKLTASGRAIESLAYETGALIMSRMLMVRFCEDHGFFTSRYISNGGVEVFSQYAGHFHKKFQALLKETYQASAALFEHLFDRTLLDWALDSQDEALSNAILKAAYLLSRWDFRTVHGDILSGVYDQYLDVGRRRALGEVYTRPEIARYMLHAAGFAPGKTLLDPACGTGTFLVEALVIEMERLRKAGALNLDTMRTVLSRLNGLDINDFAVVLAQIQIIWHLIEMLAGKTADEVRTICRALIPAVQVCGGWSSLHPLGMTFTKDHAANPAGAQAALHFNTTGATVARSGNAAVQRRRAATIVPRRFQRIARGYYDVVAMNPPYIRTHRQGGVDYDQSYAEVDFGVVDIFVFFIYRALRQWVKPGARLAVIVPISVLDAEYASRLREVLREVKILEIADLECLGKATFRGVKRNTVILVLENSAPAEDDDMEMVTLTPDCYDEEKDLIDFTKARRETVRRRDITQDSVLPDPSEMTPWFDAIERQDGRRSPLLSKLKSADLEPLRKLGSQTRLGEIIMRAYTKRTRGAPIRIEAAIPAGAKEADWTLELVAGVGLELGGKRAFARAGAPIYKGQNIFPSGILGQPVQEGFWDPTISQLKAIKIYGYQHLFQLDRLYAVRDIAQLPTACLIEGNAVFQNSAVVVQLTEAFPLNLYLLSRLPQWYAARVLRSTILEDGGCHWYKKTIPLLPVPRHRDAQVIDHIYTRGMHALEVDADIADAHRHIKVLVDASARKQLGRMVVDDDVRARDIDLTHLPEGLIPIKGLREERNEIIGGDLFFRMTVPDPDLRRYLRYALGRQLDADPNATASRESIFSTEIPMDLSAVVAKIVEFEGRDLIREFSEALDALDQAIGASIGLDAKDVEYVQREMRDDPFLAQLRPMLRQRGLRVQAYADHSEDDRYD